MALGEVGSALIKQYVTNRLLDKGIAGIEKFTDTSSDKDKDTSGFVSQQKTGGLGSIIGRALAFSLLGPILGPLAFAGGKGLLNLGQQRGFLPGGEQQIVDDPRGTFTAEGAQFANIQDTLGSTDSGVDIASGTAVTLGFHVKGTGSVEFFVNRNKVATHTANIPDDENLALGAMELSGSATGTKSMNIDYIFAAQNR